MAKKTTGLQKYLTAVKKAPDDIGPLEQLVIYYFEKKQWDKAKNVLEPFIAKYPQQPRAQHLLGNCYQQLSKIQQALSCYQTAITLYEQKQQINETLGDVYFDLAEVIILIQYFEAIPFYKKACQLNKHSKKYHERLYNIIYAYLQHILELWYIHGQFPNFYPPFSLITKKRLELQQKINFISITTGTIEQFCQGYLLELQKNAQSPFMLEFLLNQLTKNETIIRLIENNPQQFARFMPVVYTAIAELLRQALPEGIGLEILMLPKLREQYNWERPSNNNLLIVQEKWKEYTPNNSVPMINQCCYAILQLLIDGLCEGTEIALNRFIKKWFQYYNQDELSMILTSPLWNKLYHYGWFQKSQEEQLIQIICHYKNQFIITKDELENVMVLNKMLLLKNLGYTIGNTRDWNEHLFYHLVLPQIKQSLQHDYFDYAYKLAEITDFSFAQQPHTEQQHKLCWSSYLDDTLKAGYRIRKKWPPLSNHTKNNTIKNVAMIVKLSFNRASPIVVIYNILRSIHLLADNQFQFKIYAVGGCSSQKVIDEFNSIGVEVDNSFMGKNFTFLEQLEYTRQRLQEDNVIIAIYVQSTIFYMALAATVRLAPIQVHWSMGGYFSFRIPEIQGYLRLGSPFEEKKIISGYEWICTAPPVITLSKSYPQGEIKKLRDKFSKNAIILATIGRPQKLSTEFLETLAKILELCPQCIFLWFGLEENEFVKNTMLRLKIINKCFYQGFVDSILYANIIDIHLDSFPYPCGSTILEAAVAGKPSVLYVSNESLQTGMPQHIYPFLKKEAGSLEIQNYIKSIFIDTDGTDLSCCSENEEQYITNTMKLINDTEFYKKSANAFNKFIKNSFMDEYLPGKSFIKNLLKFLNENK